MTGWPFHPKLDPYSFAKLLRPSMFLLRSVIRKLKETLTPVHRRTKHILYSLVKAVKRVSILTLTAFGGAKRAFCSLSRCLGPQLALEDPELGTSDSAEEDDEGLLPSAGMFRAVDSAVDRYMDASHKTFASQFHEVGFRQEINLWKLEGTMYVHVMLSSAHISLRANRNSLPSEFLRMRMRMLTAVDNLPAILPPRWREVRGTGYGATRTSIDSSRRTSCPPCKPWTNCVQGTHSNRLWTRTRLDFKSKSKSSALDRRPASPPRPQQILPWEDRSQSQSVSESMFKLR